MLDVSHDGGLPPGFLTAVGTDSVQPAEDSRLINTVKNLRAQEGSVLFCLPPSKIMYVLTVVFKIKRLIF